MNLRWKKRPEGSNWGDFGPDDELGTLNHITPDVVRKAIAEVREGLSFCLSLPLDLPGGSELSRLRHPPVVEPVKVRDVVIFNRLMSAGDAAHTDVVCDDMVHLHTQYSTQWDSLAHVGSVFDADDDGDPEIVYYNGFRGGEDIVASAGVDGNPIGARKLGIDKMAVKAIQSRGVMVNLAKMYGAERKFVGYDELLRAIGSDGPERGDILCLYTGFADMVLEMNGRPDRHLLEASCAVLDGRDERLQKWIADSGIAAIAADNFGVEAFPAKASDQSRHAALPLHEFCLFKLGMPLGELWFLRDLANWLDSQGRTRFLLTAPPLRLPRAVGSPVTPVATV